MNKKLNIHKTLYTVIGLNIIQIMILIGYFIYSYTLNLNTDNSVWFNSASLLIVLIVFTTLINSFFIIKDSHYIINFSAQNKMVIDSMHQIEDLNNTLRAQRHDFINQLQVVHSLIEMDEYNEARNYIEKIYTDIQKVSKSLKTSNPAINALLQAKMLNCEKHDIKVILNVSSNLTNMIIPSWEMCRILGNLIDNAIYALNERTNNRILIVDIYEASKTYVFSIEDNGTAIPDHVLDKIYEPGFSTKGGKGEGMGLFIANDIIKSHGGTIKVTSNAEKTTFIVVVPKIDSNQR